MNYDRRSTWASVVMGRVIMALTIQAAVISVKREHFQTVNFNIFQV